MYDYNRLKNLIIPGQFGPDDYGEETDSMEQIMDQLPEEVDVCWGATQFVIIDPEQDKVAKFAFNGEYYWNEETYEDENEETFNIPTFEPYHKDYADLGYDLFCKAEEEDIDILFAKVEFFGKTVSGNKIYLQEKVISYDDDWSGSSEKNSENSKNSYKKLVEENSFNGIKWFPKAWATAVIEWYGEELLKAFLKFINKYNLTDWHDGNIGWRKDGSPCILDWAGYDE